MTLSDYIQAPLDTLKEQQERIEKMLEKIKALEADKNVDKEHQSK